MDSRQRRIMKTSPPPISQTKGQGTKILFFLLVSTHTTLLTSRTVSIAKRYSPLNVSHLTPFDKLINK